MSAIILEMLLKAYYLGKGLHEDTGLRSPAHNEGIHWLVSCGLIELEPLVEGYHVTTRGRVFIRMILDTPLPEKQWVDPR